MDLIMIVLLLGWTLILGALADGLCRALRHRRKTRRARAVTLAQEVARHLPLRMVEFGLRNERRNDILTTKTPRSPRVL